MSLKSKINRMKSHITTNQEIPILHQENTTKGDFPYRDIWEKENVYPYYLDDQYCFIREVRYPLTYQHGKYYFSDFLKALDIWNQGQHIHPLSAAGHQAEDLFFFDTETTGLGGGAGNTIFLLGYASIKGSELILRQHILPHPGAEVPLYQSFLEKVNYKTLVTYNGKSFDWPQVKTRHTLVRDHVPKLPSFGHFDLYHAARRIWKHRLDRLKLSIVEKEILEIERMDDIPGYLAPMIYFDFVENKQPDGMIGVLKHNEIDILSLVTLYTHLTFHLCGYDIVQSRRESFEIGRWYSTLGEKYEAEKIFKTLMDGSDQTSQQAKLSLAFQYKKEQKWEKAKALFLETAKQPTEVGLKACIEASKILEHKDKDYPLAIQYCTKAIEIWESTSNVKNDDLLKRLSRLKGKYQKFPG